MKTAENLFERLLKARFITSWEWITIVGVLVASAASCVVYAFSTFEQKSDHTEFEHRTDQRLERMDNKLDRLIERRN